MTPLPSSSNPLSVPQLNKLYRESPSGNFNNVQVPLPDPMQALHSTVEKRPPTSPVPGLPPPPPPVAGIPAVLSHPAALVTAATLVLLTPKPTANEDAILRRLKKQEIEKKVVTDPPESPKPLPPPFLGGQSECIIYNVQFEFTTNQGSGRIGNFFRGPILGARIFGTTASNPGALQVNCRGWYFQECYASNEWVEVYSTGNPEVLMQTAKITSVKRADNLPDTGGNLPTTTPPPSVIGPNTKADPNRFKRDIGDRPAPAATPKYIDARPAAPGAGWGHAVPPDKRRQTTRSGTRSPIPTRASSANPAPAPTKIYFPQQQPLETSPASAPQQNPQERPFPPQSVPDGISPQPAPRPLAPPSQKTDTAPIPAPTSRPTVSPPVPAPTPTPNRTPTAIPAPNPIPQPVIIYGPSYDPGKGGPITYSSPPQNFVPSPSTGAPVPQAPPTVKPPTEPTPTKTPIEEIGQKLQDLALPIGTIGVGITQILKRTTPEELEKAAAAGTCRTTQPSGCTTAAINRGNDDLKDFLKKNGLDAAAQIEQLKLLNRLDNKMGAQMPGGVAGAFGRLSNFLGVDRIFNLINFMANLHNAFMLSNSLKITLLEMLSSVGNATGLLQSSEGDNVDLNAVYDKGIRALINSVLGDEQAARLEIQFRRANRIYQAATNSLNAVSSMMSSLGNVVEVGAEYGGKIGNALKAAGAVHEKAYQWMAEKFDAKVSPFMKYSQTVNGVNTALETINEIAESVVEGQQAATEFQKANTDFLTAVAEVKKNPGIENKAVAEEIKKQKENATKDPTGEDETGLLSFLTDL